jgi:hypothetical protein
MPIEALEWTSRPWTRNGSVKASPRRRATSRRRRPPHPDLEEDELVAT